MDAANLPDYVRPDVLALQAPRKRSRILAAGTDAVHEAGELILPKWGGEDYINYGHRATLCEFAEFYGRTIEAACGLLFGSDLDIDGTLPPRLAMIADDADGAGLSLHAMARRLADGILTDGLAGVVAEYPRVADPSAVSERDVQEQRLRPYLVPVAADQVLSWRTATVGAETYLTQLVLAESVEVDDGEYGVTAETRYRVYRHDLGTRAISVAVYKIVGTAAQKTAVLVSGPDAIIGPDRIPFAVGYAAPPAAMLVAGPPLDRLGWLNIGHYRVSADHRYLMSVCHAPTLCIEHTAGDDTSPITLGVNSVLKLTNEATAKWLQASADALEPAERTIERQSQQMAALGMAFLARDTTRNETATGRKLDAVADRATIGTLADGLGQMLTQAVAFCGSYVGADTVPAIAVQPDYDVTRLDAQTITALGVLADAGRISTATLLTVLQNGDVLPDGLDLVGEESAALGDMVARAVLTAPEPEPQAQPQARAA